MLKGSFKNTVTLLSVLKGAVFASKLQIPPRLLGTGEKKKQEATLHFSTNHPAAVYLKQVHSTNSHL